MSSPQPLPVLLNVLAFLFGALLYLWHLLLYAVRCKCIRSHDSDDAQRVKFTIKERQRQLANAESGDLQYFKVGYLSNSLDRRRGKNIDVEEEESFLLERSQPNKNEEDEGEDLMSD